MRRTMVWTAAAMLALTGAAYGQNGEPTQQRAGTQQQAQVHKPADGKGLGKEQAKLAKQQKKQAERAAKQAEKAAKRAEKEQRRAAKAAKAGPGDGTGNQGNRPKDGTGYGVGTGKRGGPVDGTGPQVGQDRGGLGGAQTGRQGGGGRRGR